MTSWSRNYLWKPLKEYYIQQCFTSLSAYIATYLLLDVHASRTVVLWKDILPNTLQFLFNLIKYSKWRRPWNRLWNVINLFFYYIFYLVLVKLISKYKIYQRSREIYFFFFSVYFVQTYLCLKYNADGLRYNLLITGILVEPTKGFSAEWIVFAVDQETVSFLVLWNGSCPIS